MTPDSGSCSKTESLAVSRGFQQLRFNTSADSEQEPDPAALLPLALALLQAGRSGETRQYQVAFLPRWCNATALSWQAA